MRRERRRFGAAGYVMGRRTAGGLPVAPSPLVGRIPDMERCKLRPAYDRSPAEKAGLWMQEHFLRLISATVSAVAFWFLFGWLIDCLLNFMATGGQEDAVKPYASGSPMMAAVRLVGCGLLAYWMLFRLHFRNRC